MSLDAALAKLVDGVSELSRRQAAAVFSLCGEALFPLYEEFVRETGWGDPAAVLAAKTLALDFAIGGEVRNPEALDLLEKLASASPDGEEFDAPGSTYAQDVVICVDAALRATIDSEPIRPEWIEFAVEPITQFVCEDQTGFLDLGGDGEADAWKRQALADERLRRAFEGVNALISRIRTSHFVAIEDLGELRVIASHLVPRRSN